MVLLLRHRVALVLLQRRILREGLAPALGIAALQIEAATAALRDTAAASSALQHPGQVLQEK